MIVFLFFGLFTRLEREVVRNVVAQVSVHEVANKRLQSWQAFLMIVEDHLFVSLLCDVVTGSYPLVNCCNYSLRRNLHWKKHLDEFLAGFILVKSSLGYVARDFPDFKKAEDDFFWVLLSNWLKKWDYTALNQIEILLHVSFEAKKSLFGFRCAAGDSCICPGQYCVLGFAFDKYIFLVCVLVAQAIVVLVAVFTDIVKDTFRVLFMEWEDSEPREVAFSHFKDIQIVPAIQAA